MDEKDATKEVESRDEEEVVLAVTAFTEETLETGDQSYGDWAFSLAVCRMEDFGLRTVPLETFLQLEEFSEGRVFAQ